MADKERLRLRATFAELLSPAAVSQTARGTITVHDEPVVGGSVKGQAGQEYLYLYMVAIVTAFELPHKLRGFHYEQNRQRKSYR